MGARAGPAGRVLSSGRQAEEMILQLFCDLIPAGGQDIAGACRVPEVAAAAVALALQVFKRVAGLGFPPPPFLFLILFMLGVRCVSSRYSGLSFIANQLNVIVASFWSASLFIPVKKRLPL